jgi:hypothetical protein
VAHAIPGVKSKFGKFLLWCGVLALLGVVILWIEHGRCAAQLAAYQRSLTARGDKLTLQELLPPDPPPTSNAAVVLQRLAPKFEGVAEELPWMQLVSSNAARVALHHDPLVQLNKDITWGLIAERAAKNTNLLTEILGAAALPRFALFNRTNLDRSFFQMDTMPDLSDREVVPWLSLHAMAAARAGRAEEAWMSWRAALQFYALRSSEIAGLSFLGGGLNETPFHLTWELAQKDDWTDAQLAELQALWSQWRPLQSSGVSEPAARAIIFKLFDELRAKPGYLALTLESSYPSFSTSGGFSPTEIWNQILDNPKRVLGFFSDRFSPIAVWPWWTSYGDELWVLREFDRHAAAVRTASASNSVLVALALLDSGKAPAPSRWWPIARVAVGSEILPDLFKLTVVVETQARLATTALAVRRYQLAHRRPPPTLDDLVPQFLPRVIPDPIDGKPLRYSLQPNGGFLLYSIGPDGVDDGGDATRPIGLGSLRIHNLVQESRWQISRDWIWPLPATAEETEKQAAEYLSKRTPGPGIPLPPPPPPPTPTPP